MMLDFLWEDLICPFLQCFGFDFEGDNRRRSRRKSTSTSQPSVNGGFKPKIFRNDGPIYMNPQGYEIYHILIGQLSNGYTNPNPGGALAYTRVLMGACKDCDFIKSKKNKLGRYRCNRCKKCKYGTNGYAESCFKYLYGFYTEDRGDLIFRMSSSEEEDKQ